MSEKVVPKAVSTAHGDSGGRAVLLYASLAILVVALYWATFSTMGRMWRLSAYQYGFIVIPIAAYLLWRRRDLLAAVPLKPSMLGLAALPVLVAAWLVARGTSIQLIEQLAVLAMIPAAGLAVGGWRAFGVAAFPLLFVMAALPVGDGLIPQLIVITAAIAEWLLHFFGVPAYRQGQIFVLPGGSFEVADVCSGLMYLLAGTVVSILYAQLTYRSTWKRIVFVVLAAVLFVVANGVRAFIVMVVASATELEWFAGNDHVIFGHVMFGVLILLLFWISARFADPAPAATATHAGMAASPARIPVIGWVLTAMLLALGPVIAAQSELQATGPVPHVQLPTLSGCDGPGAWNLSWTPVFAAPDVEASGSYACGVDTLNLYVAGYRSQGQGKELVSDGNQLVSKRVLAYLERGSAEFADATGARLRVSELRGRQDGGHLIIWYWYSINGQPAFSDAEVKLREAVATVTGQPSFSAVHMLVIEASSSDESVARASLEQLATAAWTQFVSAESWRVND